MPPPPLICRAADHSCPFIKEWHELPISLPSLAHCSGIFERVVKSTKKKIKSPNRVLIKSVFCYVTLKINSRQLRKIWIEELSKKVICQNWETWKYTFRPFYNIREFLIYHFQNKLIYLSVRCCYLDKILMSLQTISWSSVHALSLTLYDSQYASPLARNRRPLP